MRDKDVVSLEGQERGEMLRDLGRRDPFHPTGPGRLMRIPGGIPAAEDGRSRPRPVCSGGTQQRPYKLDTQVFFPADAGHGGTK